MAANDVARVATDIAMAANNWQSFAFEAMRAYVVELAGKALVATAPTWAVGRATDPRIVALVTSRRLPPSFAEQPCPSM